MEIIERKPVPIYENICPECESRFRYRGWEVSNCCITCPVCGISLWANTSIPFAYDPPKEDDDA